MSYRGHNYSIVRSQIRPACRVATWSQAIELFLTIGDENMVDWSTWPIFEELPVLPSGVVSGWVGQESGFAQYADLDFTSGMAESRWIWQDEVLAWWLAENYDENLQQIDKNRVPYEHQAMNFDGDFVTKSAYETMRALWTVRGEPERALAVLIRAWFATYVAGSKGERCTFGCEPELQGFASSIEEAAQKATSDVAIEWHWAGSRMLPLVDLHRYDVFSSERLLDRYAEDLLRRMLVDCQRSQVKARMVHLTRDPNFDEAVFRAKLEERAAAARREYEEERIASERRWEERQKRERAVQEAWMRERKARVERLQLYKTSGIDVGCGPVDLTAAGKVLGVPKPTVTRWARSGLSVEQMKYLAAHPKKGTRMDERLAVAGLIPGVAAPTVVTEAQPNPLEPK